MAKKKDTPIFSIFKISTDNFEKEELENLDKNIDISLSLSVGVTNIENNTIKVSPGVTFSKNKLDFISIEISVFFSIDKETWEGYISKDKSSITIPSDILTQLINISIGILRGSLHAKTENTILNRYFIPYIEHSKIIEGDRKISFDKGK